MFTKQIPVAVDSTGALRVSYEIGLGYKLAAGTWYIDCSMPDAVNAAVHCSWDSTIVISALNIQTSGMPAYKSLSAPFTDSSGAVDVSGFAADTTGLWLKQDPSTAYVPITPGAGTVTNMTVAIAGGTAGGCEFDIGNLASRRCRTKLVVTTGGYFRQHTHGKMA
jgi:hypothetical protein